MKRFDKGLVEKHIHASRVVVQNNFVGLALAQIVPKVDHSPPKVFCVHLLLSLFVNSCENLLQSFEARLFSDKISDVLENLVNIEFLQSFNVLHKCSVWRGFKHPDVLVLMVPSWHISCDCAFLFEL